MLHVVETGAGRDRTTAGQTQMQLKYLHFGERTIRVFESCDREWRRWRLRNRALTISVWPTRFYPRVSRFPRIVGALVRGAARYHLWTWGAGVRVGVSVICFAACSATAAETKRVLILHSFGRDFQPWNEYAVNIRTELDRQSRWKLDIHDHSLMAARSNDEDPYVAFVGYLVALYAKGPSGINRCI